jgi:hypothetical protein
MLIVFCGDLHVGSSVAVCPPQVDMGDDGIYSATELQLWLYDKWQKFTAEIVGRREKIVLVLMGDLVDGPRHHNTFQSWGTAQAQVCAAVELLRPLANVAGKVYGVKGTTCHGGASGQDDVAVVKELGGETKYRWRLAIDGTDALWDVAHHARRDTRETTIGNSAMGIIRQAELRCNRTGEQRPDYIIRGHAHEADVLTHNGITCGLCPAWKLQDEYTRKLDAASLADIGGLLWQNGKLTSLLYPPAPDPITVVKLPTPSEY